MRSAASYAVVQRAESCVAADELAAHACKHAGSMPGKASSAVRSWVTPPSDQGSALLAEAEEDEEEEPL